MINESTRMTIKNTFRVILNAASIGKVKTVSGGTRHANLVPCAKAEALD